MPYRVKNLKPFFVFLFVITALPALNLPAQPAPLYYVQIGSGVLDQSAFRTVFRFTNEKPETVEGELEFFALDSSPLAVELSIQWSAEGFLEQENNQVRFRVPPESSLELTLVPRPAVALGWAKLEMSDDIVSQAFFQVAQGDFSQGDVSRFEKHLISEAENKGMPALKSFSFPIALPDDGSRLNTALAMVNLSAAPVEVQILRRPDEVLTTVIPAHGMFSEYVDRFVTTILRERPASTDSILSTGVIRSEVPLAAAVFRTIEGIPQSGVQLAPRPENPETQVPASLDTQFELAINQSISIDDGNLQLTFWNLAEDSRCPIGATCVWEGQAVVILQARVSSDEEKSLRLVNRGGQGGLSEAVVGPYSIRLIEVTPYPNLTLAPIKLSDYRATLMVTRNRE